MFLIKQIQLAFTSSLNTCLLVKESIVCLQLLWLLIDGNLFCPFLYIGFVVTSSFVFLLFHLFLEKGLAHSNFQYLSTISYNSWIGAMCLQIYLFIKYSLITAIHVYRFARWLHSTYHRKEAQETFAPLYSLCRVWRACQKLGGRVESAQPWGSTRLGWMWFVCSSYLVLGWLLCIFEPLFLHWWNGDNNIGRAEFGARGWKIIM